MKLVLFLLAELQAALNFGQLKNHADHKYPKLEIGLLKWIT